MHPRALLNAAAELVGRVLRFDAPADAVVSAYFRQQHQLGARDRHALAETVYATLRRRLLWQHLARSGSGPAERRIAMLAWQGEAALLSAALDSGERIWLDRARHFDLAGAPEKLRHNLPDWLAHSLKSELGEDEFWALVRTLDEPASLDLRVNRHRAKREAVHGELAAAGIASLPTRYSPWGLRVAGKPALNKLPLFVRGDVEVQDEGSQLLALLVDPKRGEMVVDFCAGAGGKTLALGAQMRSTGRLYALDTSGHRLAALKPRLRRSGLSNVYPLQIAHERDQRIQRLVGKVDRVLVDAPCTGLGTLRRNPDLKWRQGPEAVAELQGKQSAILAAAAGLPKSGGRLVYATCSLLSDENEAVVKGFAASHPDYRLIDAEPLLLRAGVDAAAELVRDGQLRLWPHRHGTDGFFAAVFERA